jgi:hypothetical protein
MSEDLEDELAALREMVVRFPTEGRPGPTIPESLGNGGAGGLPGERVRNQQRWADLDRHTERVSGQRVLVVGGDVAYDAAAFAARGASFVAACAPEEVPGAPSASGSTEGSTVEVLRLDWSTLDPASHGRFDLVHCGDLLHRVIEPTTLLRTLRQMTAPGGTLLIGSMMLADPERSEYLRYVPGSHAGDGTWWFVPGRLALRWMLQTAGFEVQEEFGEREGPRDGFPIVSAYLRAVTCESSLTAGS